MKQLSLLILAGFLAIAFSSCNKNGKTVTVTYQEATAVYGDLEAVRSQPLNDAVRAVENPGKIFVGTNFILLGEEEKGVHVINNTDISNPQFVNFINIPGNREFYVKGNYLYAESYYDLIKLDVSNLNNIQLVARAENIFQETMFNDNGEALLGFSFKEVTEKVDIDNDIIGQIEGDQRIYYDFARNIIPKSAVPASFAGNSNDQSGTVNRITVNQEHVYVINSRSMAIVDDSNSSFALSPNRTAITEGAETVFPYEDKLFVGGRTAMNIYDTANPKQPLDVYQFNHATSCDPVLPQSGVAYVTLRTADFSDCPGDANALIVLDIEDISNTTQVEEIAMKSPYGMTIVGSKLFIGEGENGLSIFDITNKKDPKLLKHDDNVYAYDIIAHPGNPNLILIAGTDGLSQYTIDNALDLTINSRVDF